MQSFSNEQIIIGKKLVKWLASRGLHREVARRNVRGILLSYPLAKVKSAMSHSGCTSLDNLKRILKGSDMLKKDEVDE